jgi:hypothetical protein
MFIAGFISHTAFAGVCEYTPSKMIKSGSPAGIVIGAKSAATGAAVVGAGMKAAGFYALTHSVTGATMLASTASGSSTAGTIGIIGGTGGGVGAVSAIIMSPIFHRSSCNNGCRYCALRRRMPHTHKEIINSTSHWKTFKLF